MDHERGERDVPHGAVTEQSLPVSHTPGPWETRPITGDLDRFGYGKMQFGSRQHGLVGSLIARPNEFGVAEANARLIAAAPDMLAALERLVVHPEFPACPCRQPECLTAAINAAIAKATGKHSKDSAMTAQVEDTNANLS